MSVSHTSATYSPSTLRTCRHCGRPLKGRADKKFCSYACRNAHNNRVRMKMRTRIRANSFQLAAIGANEYWKKKYFDLLGRYWVLRQYWESLSKRGSVH